jgi:cell division septal protein FtsQ
MSVVVPLPPDRPPDPPVAPASLRRLTRFCAAIAALCAAAAFPASAIFDLQTVTVTGNMAVPTDEILRRADLRPGVSAFGVNAETIRGRLREDPRIGDVMVAMAFPRQLELMVRERAAVAALVLGEGYLLVSADGVAIVPSDGPGSLPVLSVERLSPSQVSVGTVVRSSDVRLGAQITGTLPDLIRDRVAAVRVDGAGEAALALRDGIVVRLGGRGGIADRLEMLPQVLDAIVTRGLHVESVDLRFPGNVVVQPLRTGAPARVGGLQEKPPLRGIPALHRPSSP